MLNGAVIACVLVATTATAAADRVVALAPLSTLGTEDTSAASKKLTAAIEAGLAALPGTKIVTALQVSDAIKKAKKPSLRLCERDPSCLAEVGKLVGANIVIDGEVGGLGESQVVYLGATDVATGKELRSTTLQVGTKDDGGGPGGAAVRLLDPDRYRGSLHFVIDVNGATVYVNGTRAQLSPKNDVTLPVGTQAVRVTHPEYRDFVKFIDVGYNRTTDVAVGMTQYPILKHDLQGKPISTDRITYVDPPWYRRPVVVGVGAGVLMIATAIIVGNLVHSFPDGECRRVGGEKC
ncbi:MAG: PEGA domain-containing protein [Deltaproteobacteria bacterium]|nr:PEGA domain-containing protein [Deltaproteobacteria bacterium]